MKLIWKNIMGTKDVPILTKQEQIQLCKKAKRGCEKSKEILVFANIKQVIKIAEKYDYDGLELEDLVQEGIRGIFNAIKRYDSGKNTKFSTYCHIWIYNYIAKYVRNHAKPVRFPSAVIASASKIKKYCDRFITQYGKTPPNNLLKKRFKLTDRQLARILSAFFPIQSFQEPVGNNMTVGDIIGEIPEENIIDDSRIDNLRTAMRTLSKTERSIVNFRYGFGKNMPHTLKQLHEKTGKSIPFLKKTLNMVHKKLKTNIKL